jgi:hypothetical protein
MPSYRLGTGTVLNKAENNSIFKIGYIMLPVCYLLGPILACQTKVYPVLRLTSSLHNKTGVNSRYTIQIRLEFLHKINRSVLALGRFVSLVTIPL